MFNLAQHKMAHVVILVGVHLFMYLASLQQGQHIL